MLRIAKALRGGLALVIMESLYMSRPINFRQKRSVACDMLRSRRVRIVVAPHDVTGNFVSVILQCIAALCPASPLRGV